MPIVLGDPNNVSVFGFRSGGGVNLIATFGYIGGDGIEPITITDHTARTLSLLIEEFKRSERLNDKIAVVCDLIQDIESEGNKLLNLRRLGQAGGAQLDGIGKIVGEERQGRDDQDYQDAILIRIYLNTASGQPEVLIQALAFVTQGERIKIWEYQPASLAMYTDGPFVPQNIVSEIEKIAGGGIRVLYISSSAKTIPFAFANDDGSTPDEGSGLNEYDYAPGGVEIGGQIVEGYININKGVD